MDEDRKELIIKYLNKIYTCVIFFKSEVSHRKVGDCPTDITARELDLAETLESYVSIVRGPCYDEGCGDDLFALIRTLDEEIEEHDLIIEGLKKRHQDVSKRIWEFNDRKSQLIRLHEEAWENIRKDTEKKHEEKKND